MKNLYLFAILFILFFFGCGRDTREVTFMVELKKPIASGEKVFITGNRKSLGQWQPNVVPLDKRDSTIWILTEDFHYGEELFFKITRGKWENEATGENGENLSNYFIKVSGDTTVNLTVENWKDEKFVISGQITGDYEVIGEMTGQGILTRSVFVWFPPGYKSEKAKKYPVLYMHDGQNIIDPTTSFTQIDWQVDEVVTTLSVAGKMKEIIIVGMNNTETRTADYSWTDRGRAYIKFVIDVVKPYMDKNYRTLPGPENTAVMGSSSGGLISFIMAWQHPEVFGSAACLSPAFVEPFDIVFEWIREAKEKKNTRFYIDCGDLNVDKRLLPDSKKMVRELEKLGYKLDDDLFWFYDKGADHNEAAWAKRIDKPLLFMFGK